MSVDTQEVTDFARAIGAVERAACQHLRRLATAVPSGQSIVEIGAFKGRTTGFLALGAHEGNGAPVTSVDPWDLRPLDSWPDGYFDLRVIGEYGQTETYQAWLDHVARTGLKVEHFRGYAVDAAEIWDQPVGLLWHDAQHDADAVAADLEAWAPHVAPSGWVVAHDAGNPNFGVVEGMRRVLNAPGWDWKHRKLMRWRKRPDRRGLLCVQRKP